MIDKAKAEEIKAAFSNAALVYAAIAENASHMARAYRALFDSYLSEGFTEQQALELVKAQVRP